MANKVICLRPYFQTHANTAWVFLSPHVAGVEAEMLGGKAAEFFMDAKDEDMLEYGFNCVFYHLTEHTNFALTDFIYVRDFEKSIVVIREEEKSYLS